MRAAFLLDENLPTWWVKAMSDRLPMADIRCVGGTDAPVKQSSDPDILDWCEAHGFVLLTDNRKTMPIHLAAHIVAGREVPGIFTVDQGCKVGSIIDDLQLVLDASFEDEYKNVISYLPL